MNDTLSLNSKISREFGLKTREYFLQERLKKMMILGYKDKLLEKKICDEISTIQETLKVIDL